jgi:hypothetical protein
MSDRILVPLPISLNKASSLKYLTPFPPTKEGVFVLTDDVSVMIDPEVVADEKERGNSDAIHTIN